MVEISAKLSSLHIAPRKVGLIARSLKGLSARDALSTLNFRFKRSSIPLTRLLKSAIANAKNNAKITNPEEHLFVKNIRVDSGRPFKRFMPRARGRAALIKKRTSHVIITLASND